MTMFWAVLAALMAGTGIGVLVMSMCVIAGKPIKEEEDMTVTEERDKLRAFAQDILEGWPDVGYLDGFELQELAHKHGLLVAESRAKPCADEGCACAEVVDPDEWDEGVTCYRTTALLKGA